MLFEIGVGRLGCNGADNRSFRGQRTAVRLAPRFQQRQEVNLLPILLKGPMETWLATHLRQALATRKTVTIIEKR